MVRMELFNKKQRKQLLKNGLPENRGNDHFPVVKLHTKNARFSWLVTEIINDKKAFALCDSGTGHISLDYVFFDDILSVKERFNVSIVRDTDFQAKHPISVYEEAAKLKREITTTEDDLIQAYNRLFAKGKIKKMQPSTLQQKTSAHSIFSDEHKL